jgi:prepilin-type N-terminal cleavage/methylation domain-containing protein
MTSEFVAARQGGLTLLEMMVVLLIAGMAITLGFQSLGQWRRANTAISQISGATQQAALTEAWLEESLRSLIPLQERPFKGSQEQLEGVTTQPVQSHQGGATPIVWSIHSEAGVPHLLLKEDEEEGQGLDLPLPGASEARFAYMDEEGRLHTQWPPELGLHAHLPAAIVLEQDMEDGSKRLWAAAISGARNPRFNPFEVDLE